MYGADKNTSLKIGEIELKFVGFSDKIIL